MGWLHSKNKVITFTYNKDKRIDIESIIGNNIEKVSIYICKELLKRIQNCILLFINISYI